VHFSAQPETFLSLTQGETPDVPRQKWSREAEMWRSVRPWWAAFTAKQVTASDDWDSLAVRRFKLNRLNLPH